MRSACSLAAFATAAALLVNSSVAQADPVSATGKGITGGALLGGEVVMLGEAAIGVKPAWAYLLGGVVGAGGMGYLGYTVEKGSDPKYSLYMLAGGMALLIPTTVAVLQSTSYHPPSDYTEDRPAAGVPIAEPPRPSAPPAAPAAPGAPVAPAAAPGPTTLHMHWDSPRLKMPLGLVDMDEGDVHLAVPAIEVRPMYSMAELQKYGVQQQQELRVPIFSATF